MPPQQTHVSAFVDRLRYRLRHCLRDTQENECPKQVVWVF